MTKYKLISKPLNVWLESVGDGFIVGCNYGGDNLYLRAYTFGEYHLISSRECAKKFKAQSACVYLNTLRDGARRKFGLRQCVVRDA